MALITATSMTKFVASKILTAVNNLITGFTNLASNATGMGASQVGIEDSAGIITATTVEGALAELAARCGKKLVTFTVSPGAEGAGASNAIDCVIQCVDMNGNPLAQAQKFEMTVYKSTMIQATSSEFRLSKQGAPGTEISTTANPTMLLQTDATGAITVRVLDQAGTYTGTAYVRLVPISDNVAVTPGVSRLQALTYA